MFSATYKKLANNDLASAALILLAITCFIQTSHLFNRLDNLVFDVGQKLITQPAPNDIIIIAIDEYSLSEFGRWPWPRKTHADLLNRLSSENPAAIGFDIIFSEPDQSDPASDLIFSNAIEQAGNVVLPMLLESTRVNGQIIETLPLPLFVNHAADIGRVHAVFDEDSIVRSVYLYEGLNSPAWQLFAQAVINTAEKFPSKNNFESNVTKTDATDVTQTPLKLFTIQRKDQRIINFLGPVGHFPRISYAQVVKGEFPKGLFNHKIVLVGATALGMDDLLTTPVSGLGLPMPGVEFQANVLENLRNNSLIHQAPFALSLMIVSLLALAPLIWLPKQSPLTGFMLTMFTVVVVTLFSSLLPKLIGIWIPSSGALASLLLAFPIWSWRKLESAQKYFDIELDALKQNLPTLPDESIGQNTIRYDKFAARISQVKLAAEQLKHLQMQRKETLEFISHDIRAPIALALSLLEKHNTDDEKLHKPLSRALALSDEFLHTSRAEIIGVTTFTEIEYSGLVHQAIDDAHDLAMQKQMQLRREISDNMIWVIGSFGLLHRAILNLVLNAVKYGNRETEILIALSLSADKTQAIFSVTNDGVGIPIDNQSQLFKRFSRVNDHELISDGLGIGLYFVKTVAEKHKGTVQVNSDEHKPTTFSLTLPIAGFLSSSD